MTDVALDQQVEQPSIAEQDAAAADPSKQQPPPSAATPSVHTPSVTFSLCSSLRQAMRSSVNSGSSALYGRPALDNQSVGHMSGNPALRELPCHRRRATGAAVGPPCMPLQPCEHAPASSRCLCDISPSGTGAWAPGLWPGGIMAACQAMRGEVSQCSCLCWRQPAAAAGGLSPQRDRALPSPPSMSPTAYLMPSRGEAAVGRLCQIVPARIERH